METQANNSSDGEIKAQEEVNCSKSHSLSAAELGWTLASVFFPQHQGKTSSVFLPKKLNWKEKKKSPAH